MSDKLCPKGGVILTGNCAACYEEIIRELQAENRFLRAAPAPITVELSMVPPQSTDASIDLCVDVRGYQGRHDTGAIADAVRQALIPSLLVMGESIDNLRRPCTSCADMQLCWDSDCKSFAEAITTAHADRKLAETQARLAQEELERVHAHCDRAEKRAAGLIGEVAQLERKLDSAQKDREWFRLGYQELREQQASLRASASRWTRRVITTLGALSAGATIGYGVQHWGWQPDIRVAVVLAALFALPRVWRWLQRCAAEEERRQQREAEEFADGLIQCAQAAWGLGKALLRKELPGETREHRPPGGCQDSDSG